MMSAVTAVFFESGRQGMQLMRTLRLRKWQPQSWVRFARYTFHKRTPRPAALAGKMGHNRPPNPVSGSFR
jgi:hypothetical protein